MIQQYEYKIIKLKQPSDEELTRLCNELGKCGWVLVDSFGNCRFVFSRELKVIGPSETKEN